MTTHRTKRCQHCLVVYAYQGSGPGCQDATNDPHYCPDCKATILGALRSVPQKVEQFWETVTGDEAKRVLEQKKKNDADVETRRAAGELVAVRIGVPLFNMETGASSSVRFVHLDGIEYSVTTWSDGSEPPRVVRSMERDLRTGAVSPWQRINP